MSNSTQFKRISLWNQLPLNRIAATFLPKGQALETELAVLTLMRWGLDNDLGTEPLAEHHPDEDQLRTQIDRMANWEPRNAMAFLTNPERLDGEVVLEADELRDLEAPEEAAALLLENLYNAMVCTAP